MSVWPRRFPDQAGLVRHVVAVSPGASGDLKRWRLGHFAALCRDLTERLEAGLLVLCGPGEAKLLTPPAQ